MGGRTYGWTYDTHFIMLMRVGLKTASTDLKNGQKSVVVQQPVDQ